MYLWLLIMGGRSSIFFSCLDDRAGSGHVATSQNSPPVNVDEGIAACSLIKALILRGRLRIWLWKRRADSSNLLTSGFLSIVHSSGIEFLLGERIRGLSP